MATKKTPAQNLNTLVYESVKERLFRGDFPMGKRISVDALRTEFGVSKQPISEAFRTLAADGLVEILPRSGCVPRDYSRAEVQDFFAIFADFEGSTTELAARRRTEKQLAKLQEILTSHTPDIPGQEPAERSARYRLHNREFHLAILEMANSRVVISVAKRMMDISDYLIGNGAEGGRFVYHLSERHDEHAEIVAAIAAQDEAAARRFMHDHIAHAGEFATSHKVGRQIT